MSGGLYTSVLVSRRKVRKMCVCVEKMCRLAHISTDETIIVNFKNNVIDCEELLTPCLGRIPTLQDF